MPPLLAYAVKNQTHSPWHKLMAMSTMLTPAHGLPLRPLSPHPSTDYLDGSYDMPAHRLYLSNAIQAHLQKVYDRMCNGDVILTKEKFIAWFVREQGGHVAEFEKDTYKFEEFLEAVYLNYGFEGNKMLEPADLDASLPISNYFISSSHNTYLEGNQLLSRSSTEPYKTALLKNCRCIEIDVWNGEYPKLMDADTSHVRSGTGSVLSSRPGAAMLNIDGKLEKWRERIAMSTLGGLEEHLDQLDTTGRPPSIGSMIVGEPLVLHGWSLTAPVGFRAVCKAIRETAFEKSNLPIIVSLEVHADMDQQETMVTIMKEEWHGLLVDEAHEACNPDERLPRLDELLNKILIKVKKATKQAQSPDTTPVGSAPLPNRLTPNPTATTLSPNSSSATLAPIHTRTDQDSNHSGSDDDRPQKKKTNICDNLSRLGIYTHSEHFTSFAVDSAKTPCHIFSVGESRILELHQKQNAELFAHNRDYMMRAFPAGYRFDSSNLDPSVFWRRGVQMVALNWQSLDEAMMLNEGMFAGSRGWMLKPPGYRSSDPLSQAGIQYKTLDLKITIYAGQHIPLPSGRDGKGFKPYVKCELHVEEREERTGKKVAAGGKVKDGEHKQSTHHGHSDHPDYGPLGQTLSFTGISGVVEQLSFVRFKVEERTYLSDELAAWACIRLDRLQQGYRFIPLRNARNQPTEGLLFVKVEKVLRSEVWGEGIGAGGRMKVGSDLEVLYGDHIWGKSDEVTGRWRAEEQEEEEKVGGKVPFIEHEVMSPFAVEFPKERPWGG